MQALLGGMQLGAVARATPVREVEAQPDVEVARLWFVRVPKAAANDALTKQLHEQFQSHVEIVRKMNQKLGAKRETIKGLRSQMTEVRSVKGAAQPEFDDKLNRLKQLREQRNTCQARISDIRGLVKGLDCKTEAELDERLKREEEKIRFGAASLREEKQVLAELSKLRGQREKIKAYEQQKGSLVGLEAELAKIKAQIDDQDGEFSMVKGERDAASKVATRLYAKLKAVEKELEAEVAQQKEAVEKKDKVLAQLEAAKQEAEASQGDYRDNRKFSLSIREMLDRGEVEQARELCVQQTDSMMAKLLSNKGMWEDYCRALAEQRKSFVSDLLPESSTAAKAAAAEATKAAAVQPAKKAPSAKIAAAAPVVAVKPVADGTGKAKDLIASIMLQAKAEAERAIKASADAASELGSEGTSEDATSEEKSKSAPAPAAPKASAPAVAPKFVNNPAAKAAEVFGFKMEVPKVADVEMLPLPAKVEQETKSKNEVREEQRVKATEAELRKAKRQEGLKKKKAKAVVAQSKAKEEQDLANAQAAAAAAAAEAEAAEKAKEAAAAQAAVVVEAEPATDAPAGPAAVVPTVSKVKKGKLAVTALDKVVAKLEVPAAKRPAAKASLVRQVKKLYVENQKLMVLLACLVLFVALLLIASM